MNLSLTSWAVLFLALVSSCQSALASETGQLQDEIARLRAEVDALRLEREAAGDADPTLTTSLKKGLFTWSTEDGKFSLEMNFRTQVRVTYNDERGADAEGPSDPNSANASNGRDYWNFRIRRAKLSFKGNIFEKEFKYYITLAFTNGGAGSEVVEVAYFQWARFKEFNVTPARN